MSVAAITVAALLVSSPITTDADRIAAKGNTVHFTIWMAVMKSTRVVVCGARGRSG